MGESYTVPNAYTMFRHLEWYYFHPLTYSVKKEAYCICLKYQPYTMFRHLEWYYFHPLTYSVKKEAYCICLKYQPKSAFAVQSAKSQPGRNVSLFHL